MYQFKSNNNNKQTLKFGKPKSPLIFKPNPTGLFKNSLTTSSVKTCEGVKSPTNSWKKGATFTFPSRPETTQHRYYLEKSVNLTESLRAPEKESNMNKHGSSIQTSRQTQNSNPNSASSQSTFQSRSSHTNYQSQPLILSSKDESSKIQILELEINNYKHKLSDALRKKDQFQKKFQEANNQLSMVKQTNRQQSKKIVEISNHNNQLEADLYIATNKLKQKQEQGSVVSRESELKKLIITLSQQKNELSNKVSELLEQKALKDNTDTFNKIQKAMNENQIENARIEQLQQIQSLKSRINELQQQHNPNQKQYYQERIRLLQREVKQLLLKCMSNNRLQQMQLSQHEKGIIDKREQKNN